MDKVNYDDQGSAEHYRGSRIELQHQLESIWGTFQLMTFCEMSAYCYRMRAGKKIGNEIQQEIKKAEWFEKRAKFLHEKILSGKDLPGIKLDHNSLKSELEPEFLKMLTGVPVFDFEGIIEKLKNLSPAEKLKLKNI